MKEPHKPHPVASKQALEDVLHALKDLLRNELDEGLPPSIAHRERSPRPSAASAPVPLEERPIPDLFDDVPVLTDSVDPHDEWRDLPVLDIVPDRTYDLAARVMQQLNDELRASGEAPLAVTVGARLEALLRAALNDRDRR